MSYGWVEECGIRCNYHGWLIDETGRCIHQPYEEIAHPRSRAKERISIKAYPVEECAGLLWAYMGPQPAPELPVWEPFTWGNGFVQIVLSEMPCNWFQCQENSIDPVHFEWLHDNWGSASRRHRPEGADAPEARFEEFDYGFIYKRIREGQTEGDPLWTVGRVTLWPNGFYLGNHFEWRVPIDDENTLSASAGSSTACRRDASRTCRTRSRTGRPDQGRATAAGSQPRHQPGLRRLGRPGPHRRPHPGASRRKRSRHRDDAQALVR